MEINKKIWIGIWIVIVAFIIFLFYLVVFVGHQKEFHFVCYDKICLDILSTNYDYWQDDCNFNGICWREKGQKYPSTSECVEVSKDMAECLTTSYLNRHEMGLD